jgi:hypothetical protein
MIADYQSCGAGAVDIKLKYFGITLHCKIIMKSVYKDSVCSSVSNEEFSNVVRRKVLPTGRNFGRKTQKCPHKNIRVRKIRGRFYCRFVKKWPKND